MRGIGEVTARWITEYCETGGGALLNPLHWNFDDEETVLPGALCSRSAAPCCCCLLTSCCSALTPSHPPWSRANPLPGEAAARAGALRSRPLGLAC